MEGMTSHASPLPDVSSPVPAGGSPLVRAVHALEGMAPLDAVADVLSRVSSPVTGNRSLRELLQGRGAGHAIHPPLTEGDRQDRVYALTDALAREMIDRFLEAELPADVSEAVASIFVVERMTSLAAEMLVPWTLQALVERLAAREGDRT